MAASVTIGLYLMPESRLNTLYTATDAGKKNGDGQRIGHPAFSNIGKNGACFS